MLAEAVAVITLMLLAASGLTKLVDTAPTAGALEQAGLPHSNTAVRALGAFEVVAGLVGLLTGGFWLVPAILLYGGFTVFVWLAWQRHIPLQSCGCFGREDTPPTSIHFVYNALATTFLLAALIGSSTPVTWTGSLPDLLLQLAFGGIGAYLSYLVLTELPKTLNRVTT